MHVARLELRLLTFSYPIPNLKHGFIHYWVYTGLRRYLNIVQSISTEL